MKNRATSIIKIQQVLSSLFLNDVGKYLRDGPFSSEIGIVNLHPIKGTHWVIHVNEQFFDCYGCASPHQLSNIIIDRNGCFIF